LVIPIRELRYIIESSFKPLACTCDVNPGGSLTIEVSDPITGQVDLLMVGVPTQKLISVRAINELVAELRAELKGNQDWLKRNGRHSDSSKTHNR
jgi:hypothetical protein